MLIDIDDLVRRFLAWPLPESVSSDPCVITHGFRHPRLGTNLLTATEAKQMLEYVLADILNSDASAGEESATWTDEHGVPWRSPTAWSYAVTCKALEQQRIRSENAERDRDKLQQFKDYTHQRLDAAGIPHTVPSPHTAAGCRIGGRMDAVDAKLRELTDVHKEIEALREDAERYRWLRDKKNWSESGPCPVTATCEETIYGHALDKAIDTARGK